MSNRNKKSEQLGMPFGTASNRLRKMILFSLVQKLDEDWCHRCGEKIDEIRDLSIEHKEPWLDVDIDLFWDLNNIAFSHLSCNCKESSGGQVFAARLKSDPKFAETHKKMTKAVARKRVDKMKTDPKFAKLQKEWASRGGIAKQKNRAL